MNCPECKDQGHEIPMDSVEEIVSRPTMEFEEEVRIQVWVCPDCGYTEEVEL